MTLISGVKMGKINFKYKDKLYSPKALLQISKRKAKFCRKLKMHYIPVTVTYKGIEIRLFFVRYANQSKWRIIMNSNPKMSFIKTMETYQIRWTIEVFFKETKQYLGLAKCQSNDFDAHIAHISMSCISFMALALKKRFDCQETIGGLFRQAKVEMNEKTLDTKMWLLFCKIVQTLTDFFDFEPETLIKRCLMRLWAKNYAVYSMILLFWSNMQLILMRNFSNNFFDRWYLFGAEFSGKQIYLIGSNLFALFLLLRCRSKKHFLQFSNDEVFFFKKKILTL
jgi:hypothetical protein